MYYRLGHCEPQVKEGDTVKKGQQVATNGTGNGQWAAHCHFDIFKEKPSAWTNFVVGWTKEQVEAVYADPRGLEKTVMPTFDHYGYEWLQDAYYSGKHAFHSGIDLNGKGSGDADLGDPLCSPVDGVVVFVHQGTDSNGGWGDMVVIEESTKKETMKKDFVEQVAMSCGKSKDFFGDNINEKEQDDATKRLKEYREEQEQALTESDGKVSTLTSENSTLSSENSTLKASVKTLTTERDSYKEQVEEIISGKGTTSIIDSETQSETNKTSVLVSIDDFTISQLAGAFFRKIISFK